MTMRHPMTSRAKLPNCGRSSLWALPLLLLTIVATPFSPASGQTPADLVSRLRSLPPEAQSTALRRFQYFYEQRAFPNQQIPAGAYQRALADHVRKFGPMQPQPLP
jgi:hypothetical protein